METIFLCMLDFGDRPRPKASWQKGRVRTAARSFVLEVVAPHTGQLELHRVSVRKFTASPSSIVRRISHVTDRAAPDSVTTWTGLRLSI